MKSYRIVDFYVVPYSIANFTDNCKTGVDVEAIENRTEQVLISGPLTFSYDVIFKVIFYIYRIIH